MSVLQKQIAEKAGVSRATVSRAFTKAANVNPGTMRRIREAMAELGMDDNMIDNHGKDMFYRYVMVLVEDVSDTYYARIISGIHTALAPHGYRIVLSCSQGDSDTEIAQMQSAVANRYAGIIMVTAVESEALIEFLRQPAKIPIIFANRYISSVDLDAVYCDNYHCGYMTASYLIEKGHKRIAFLGGRETSVATQNRLRGFADAMMINGLTVTSDDIYFDKTPPSSGRKFMAELIQKDMGHTAAFVANDYMAAGVMRYLDSIDRKVPEDFSIITLESSSMFGEDGFDFTTIGFDPQQMGKAAADLLVKRSGDLQGERVRIVYPPQFTYRSSVRNLNAEK